MLGPLRFVGNGKRPPLLHQRRGGLVHCICGLLQAVTFVVPLRNERGKVATSDDIAAFFRARKQDRILKVLHRPLKASPRVYQTSFPTVSPVSTSS